MRGERIQIPKKRAVIGPPAKLHLMALVALESIGMKIVCILGVKLWDFTGVGGGGEGGGSVPPVFPGSAYA